MRKFYPEFRRTLHRFALVGVKPSCHTSSCGMRRKQKQQSMNPAAIWLQSKRQNRRESNPLSPASKMHSSALVTGGLEPPLVKSPHRNPPMPLFKIPSAQWPTVSQRVAHGESLRQIARSYHTSYEAVRRVLLAARKELVGGDGEPAALRTEDGG